MRCMEGKSDTRSDCGGENPIGRPRKEHIGILFGLGFWFGLFINRSKYPSKGHEEEPVW